MTYQARDEVKFADATTAQRVAPVTAAGTPINPAREDGNLQRLAGAMDYVVSGAYRLTIDGTSRLIAGPAGAGVCPGAPEGLPDDLGRIGLVREDGSGGEVHFNFGAAAGATSPQWPSAGVASLPITAAQARQLQVIASAGTVHATLLVMTPRG